MPVTNEMQVLTGQRQQSNCHAQSSDLAVSGFSETTRVPDSKRIISIEKFLDLVAVYISSHVI